MRENLDVQQKIELEKYLKELEYRKMQRRLVKWLDEYHDSIIKEATSASEDDAHLYSKALAHCGVLQEILIKEGQDKFKTYEHRVREFFVAYSDKKLALGDPYTKRLKSNLEKLWNWLRKKFGWAPAHRKLEKLISTNSCTLFKQERVIYSLLSLIKEYIEKFASMPVVVGHFAEVQKILQDANKSVSEKTEYFRKFLAANNDRFSLGPLGQEFVSVAEEILNQAPASGMQLAP